MKIADRATQKLNEAFHPSVLELVDESELHRGHGGYREGGETHFRLLIVSDAFEGQNRVARQRSIYDLLKDEIEERIHALQISARTVAEHAAQKSN